MSLPDAIGGYFSLEVLRRGEALHKQARAFQSARAAFFALIKVGVPRRIWVPWHICDEMAATVVAAGVECVRYGLDPEMGVPADLGLERDDWILYVNYFGLCDVQVREVLRNLPPEQVVIDNAQALYAPPENCLATLYSPRKFFGVPDGGYLFTSLPIPEADADDGSTERSEHLLIRLGHGAEAGYVSFQRAEKTLEDPSPRSMSGLTAALLDCIDYAYARDRRRENYSILDKALRSTNLSHFDLGRDAVPLCYPYHSAVTGLRSRLIANRIFVATYWPQAVDSNVPDFERSLSAQILPLPCDQRYGAAEMARIIEVIQAVELH